MRYLPPAAALRGGAEVRRVLQAAAPTISGMSERRESVGMGERGGKKKKAIKCKWVLGKTGSESTWTGVIKKRFFIPSHHLTYN